MWQIFSHLWTPYSPKCVNEAKRFDHSITYFNNGILIVHISISDCLVVDSHPL